uniref:Uncharacterized protein n=1 Tax=Trichobilharzia regenti TaxID=157069 RepID=A0AA85K553_TRIRE|nr:unnamed protein product [Trichobilharzia regenti]
MESQNEVVFSYFDEYMTRKWSNLESNTNHYNWKIFLSRVRENILCLMCFIINLCSSLVNKHHFDVKKITTGCYDCVAPRAVVHSYSMDIYSLTSLINCSQKLWHICTELYNFIRR